MSSSGTVRVNAPMRGVVCMLVSVLILTLSDTLTKWLSTGYPAGQLICLRSLAALLWATVFGWLVFGDLPTVATLIGASLVIASGLFILYRERKVGSTRPPVDAAAGEDSGLSREWRLRSLGNVSVPRFR